MVRHKSTGNLYRIVSENARMKDATTGNWVDCVIYSPTYENQYEMFSREKSDFYEKFELFITVTEEDLENQRELRKSIKERWDKLGIDENAQANIKENIASLYEAEAHAMKKSVESNEYNDTECTDIK